jgi:hypothetical protein
VWLDFGIHNVLFVAMNKIWGPMMVNIDQLLDFERWCEKRYPIINRLSGAYGPSHHLSLGPATGNNVAAKAESCTLSLLCVASHTNLQRLIAGTSVAKAGIRRGHKSKCTPPLCFSILSGYVKFASWLSNLSHLGISEMVWHVKITKLPTIYKFKWPTQLRGFIALPC